MNKFSFSLLLLFSPIVLCAQHFVHYSNETMGYSLKLPEDWRRLSDTTGLVRLVALAPEETGAEDNVRERLTLTIYKVIGKKDFYENYKIARKERNKSWKLINEGELLARKTKCIFYVCYFTSKKTKLTMGQVVYIYKLRNKYYTLRLTSSFAELEHYRDLFDKIAQSFSFEEAPPE